MLRSVSSAGSRRIFHVSGREEIRSLRDEILRSHGYEVRSTLFSNQPVRAISHDNFDLILIDVESKTRVQSAQDLCEEIKKHIPSQNVAFVCNDRVAIESECPDEIIRAEFNPEALVRGVQHALKSESNRDTNF